MSNSGSEEQIDQRDLTAVVRNSKVLLEYAALAGIQLPEPTINALVRAKDWSKTNPASLDETVKFYAALTELAGKAGIARLLGLRWQIVFIHGRKSSRGRLRRARAAAPAGTRNASCRSAPSARPR